MSGRRVSLLLSLCLAPLLIFLFSIQMFFNLPGQYAFAANRLALTPPMGWNSWNKFG